MWLGILCYIIGSYSAILQEMSQWVQGQFTADQNPTIQMYCGQLSDHIPLVMVLGISNSEVIGIYKYQNSDQAYYLYGDIARGKISLVESIEEDRPTGHLFMDVQENGLSGHWSNYDNQSFLPFQARPIEDIQSWDWPITNNWIKQFYGQYSGRNVELLLMKEREIIKGTLYSANERQSYFLQGSCSSDSCNKVILKVQDDQCNYVGELTGQFFQENVIFVNYQPFNAPSAFYSLPIRREIEVESVPKVSFQTIQDFAYPQQEGFYDFVKYYYKSKSILDTAFLTTPEPPDRLRTIQNGWMDIHWMNSRIITASLIYQDNMQDTFYTEFVNYDIKKQEPIQIEALFKRKSRYEQIVKKFLRQRLKGCQDSDPCANLEIEDFKHIGLLKEGFLVCTDFNMIDGQTKWIIPYEEFDQELSKGTIMNYYYKPK